MNEDMVDSVGEAIERAWRSVSSLPPILLSQTEADTIARAAISAARPFILEELREPTPEMVDACIETMLKHGVDIFLDGREVKPMWQAMLDTAIRNMKDDIQDRRG